MLISSTSGCLFEVRATLKYYSRVLSRLSLGFCLESSEMRACEVWWSARSRWWDESWSAASLVHHFSSRPFELIVVSGSVTPGGISLDEILWKASLCLQFDNKTYMSPLSHRNRRDHDLSLFYRSFSLHHCDVSLGCGVTWWMKWLFQSLSDCRKFGRLDKLLSSQTRLPENFYLDWRLRQT